MSVVEAEKPPRAEARFSRLTKGTWTMTVAAVALLGSLLSIGFTLFPSLKPDPRDHVAAALSVFGVDPGVTMGDFLRRAHPGDWKAAARAYGIDPGGAQLGFPGEVVYVRTQVDGYKHRSVTLIASFYDARTQSRLDPSALGGQQNTVATKIGLDSPSSSSVQLFFIPDLKGEPPVIIRVEMYDSRGMLAVADSPVIRDGRAPLPGAGG
jgi:hypothetical protein